MKYLKDIVIGAVALLALVFGVASYAGHGQKLGSYNPIGTQGITTTGNILSLGSAAINEFVGLTIIGNETNCGTSGYFTTTSTQTLTSAQFLSVCNDLITGTTGNVTTTFPAATSTYLVAGSPAFGGYQIQLVTNDSTNTATFVPGTGMTFKCETNGVGTTTIIGGCASNLVTVSATSTVFAIGYWDNASSSFVVQWGNQYH